MYSSRKILKVKRLYDYYNIHFGTDRDLSRGVYCIGRHRGISLRHEFYGLIYKYVIIFIIYTQD